MFFWSYGFFEFWTTSLKLQFRPFRHDAFGIRLVTK